MTDSAWAQIEYRARTRPDAVAVIGSRGVIPYGVLAREVDGIATMLIEMNILDDTLVGLKLGTSYLHLLLVLALDRLGVPSTSFAPSPSPSVYGELAAQGLTTVIAAEPPPAGMPCRWIALENQEAPKIGAADRDRLARLDSRGDCVVRIIWSSGTTGTPKGVPLTRSVMRRRIALYQWSHGLSEQSRYLCMMGMASGYPHRALMSFLSHGGAVVLPPPTPADIFAVAAATGVTHVAMLPPLLSAMVQLGRDLRRGLPTVRHLDWTGGHLPPQLAEQTRATLTLDFYNNYGSTEAGMVVMGSAALCIVDPQAVGYLFPQFTAETVDDAGQPLPAGEEGILRFKGEGIVAGYHQDAVATARSFRDGWFYPGDIGSIGPDRLLRIVGRVDDIIHIDGNKIAPGPVEGHFRAQPGVRDVAVFGFTAPNGRQAMAAALVLDAGADLDRIGQAVRAALGSQMPSRVIVVDRLPRNDNGKVVIRDLVALVEQS